MDLTWSTFVNSGLKGSFIAVEDGYVSLSAYIFTLMKRRYVNASNMLLCYLSACDNI